MNDIRIRRARISDAAAISALNNWRDYARPGDTEDFAAASALCEAAESIRARQHTTFRRLITHPWPTCMDTVSALFRSAHALSPGILDEGQKGIAGIEPDPCVDGA